MTVVYDDYRTPDATAGVRGKVTFRSPTYRDADGKTMTREDYEVQLNDSAFSIDLPKGPYMVRVPNDVVSRPIDVPTLGGPYRLLDLIATGSVIPPDSPTWLTVLDEKITRFEQTFAPVGESHIFFDTDGTPYFDPAIPGGLTTLSDTDGNPYLPAIGD